MVGREGFEPSCDLHRACFTDRGFEPLTHRPGKSSAVGSRRSRALSVRDVPIPSGRACGTSRTPTGAPCGDPARTVPTTPAYPPGFMKGIRIVKEHRPSAVSGALKKRRPRFPERRPGPCCGVSGGFWVLNPAPRIDREALRFPAPHKPDLGCGARDGQIVTAWLGSSRARMHRADAIRKP